MSLASLPRPDQPTFGELIRQARRDADLSQAALALAAGVKPQAVQQWEYDSVLVQAIRMPLVEDALQLDPGTLSAWVRHSPLYLATLPDVPDEGAIPGYLTVVPDLPAAA